MNEVRMRLQDCPQAGKVGTSDGDTADDQPAYPGGDVVQVTEQHPRLPCEVPGSVPVGCYDWDGKPVPHETKPGRLQAGLNRVPEEINRSAGMRRQENDALVESLLRRLLKRRARITAVRGEERQRPQRRSRRADDLFDPAHIRLDMQRTLRSPYG